MTQTVAVNKRASLLDDMDALDYRAAIWPYISLSKKIYDVRRIRDYRRMAVFVLRSVAMGKQMKGHIKFFMANSLRRHIVTKHSCLIEQATRAFFFNRSSFRERTTLIKEHFLFLEQTLSQDALLRIYSDRGLLLWQQPYKDDTLSVHLSFDGGQKKEGLLSVVLKIGEKKIYQVIFWIAPASNGDMALWIGALQGAPGETDTIRDLTKLLFGCRPKNFVIQVIRSLCRGLGLERIYAVTNHGFYANNHLRLDRKLKTSLNDFWLETGGWSTSDPRFYELPVIEHRKSIEEVVSHKRNLYKKRFALLSGMDEDIRKELGN